MDTQQATAADLARVREAAEQRLAYLLWLAQKLEQTEDRLIRLEAAKEIRQLLGKA